MGFLYVLLSLYMMTGIVTFWVLFVRFLGSRDLRRPDIDVDGILEFFMYLVALVVINPIRFAQVILKSAFWPVTLWLRLNGEASGSTEAPMQNVDGPAPSRSSQLSPAFYADVLQRSGRPATPHNLFALQERLGITFSTRALHLIKEHGQFSDWEAFLARAAYPRSRSEIPDWPPRVLDALVAWNPEFADVVRDLPRRDVEIMLEGSGFLDGDPSRPLPTAGEWNMKGIGQPDVRPLGPPSDAPAAGSAVPSPIPAADSVPMSRPAPRPTPGHRMGAGAHKPMGGPTRMPVVPDPLLRPRSPAPGTAMPSRHPVAERPSEPPRARWNPPGDIRLTRTYTDGVLIRGSDGEAHLPGLVRPFLRTRGVSCHDEAEGGRSNR
jgi:hypothetical protein